MTKVNLLINGIAIEAQSGQTILETAKENGIDIPTLCHMNHLFASGNCRICVVEIVGKKKLVTACTYPVTDGLEILTHSDRVRRARKTLVELLLSNHPDDCLFCLKNGECDIQDLAREFGIRERRFTGKRREYPVDLSSVSLERDPNKCILCGRCIDACLSQGIGALNYMFRGFDTLVGPFNATELYDSECVFCGQCVLTCPTGALRERSALKNVWTAIHDPGKKVAAVISPAAKIGLFEESETEWENLDGKIVTALKQIGFDYVYDMSIANETYLENITKELKEMKKRQRPLISAFCPALVLLIEKRYPHLIPYLSKIKSPQQIAGTLIKNEFYSRKEVEGMGEDLFVVAIRPCTAAKYEASRQNMRRETYRDIDAVLTSRELKRMFITTGIKYKNLTATDYDLPFINKRAKLGELEMANGLSTNISAKFNSDKLNHNISPPRLKMASFTGLGNMTKVLQSKEVFASSDFLEVLACPYGCVCGGGSTISDFEETSIYTDVLKELINADKKGIEAKTLFTPLKEANLSKDAFLVSYSSAFFEDLFKTRS